MEKIKSFATINYNEFMRQFDAFNPLSTHAKDEVEKEIDFTKAAMADVKNQVAQYNLPQNPERAAIFNKIETLFGQMRVHPRPVTYWNRTQEEALSYHLHNSHSTAEKLRNLVKELWQTVKDDRIEKDLQEYRQKKLQYLTKKEGDQAKIGEERKNYETGGKLAGTGGGKGHVSAEDAVGFKREEKNFHGKKFEGAGGTTHKQHQQGKKHDNLGSSYVSQAGTKDVRGEERSYQQPLQQGKNFDGSGSQGTKFDIKELRGEPNYFLQQQQGKNYDWAGQGAKDTQVREEERNYEGGKIQGCGDRVGSNFLGSEYAGGDDKKDHGDYQFHKSKQNEGYAHPPATSPTEQPIEGYQRDFGYYNNPPYFSGNQAGYNDRHPDNLSAGQRGSNMGAGV